MANFEGGFNDEIVIGNGAYGTATQDKDCGLEAEYPDEGRGQ